MKKWEPSFSSLEQFLNCERQWYYQRVLRLPRESSFYLSVGNLYHKVFELMVLHDVRESAPLRELVDEVYAVAASDPSWTCPTSQDNLCAEVHSNAQRVWNEVLIPLGDAKLEVEKEHKYVAKIDVRSNRIPTLEMAQVVGSKEGEAILDYKIKFSTWSRRGQDDVENSAQLAKYCILEKVNWAGYVEVPRSLRAPINVLGKHFTDDELRWWGRYFDEQAVTILSRKSTEAGQTPEDIEHRFRLAAPGSKLCDARYCSYWGRCPGGGGKN